MISRLWQLLVALIVALLLMLWIGLFVGSVAGAAGIQLTRTFWLLWNPFVLAGVFTATLLAIRRRRAS
jgi:hypothetical protein